MNHHQQTHNRCIVGDGVLQSHGWFAGSSQRWSLADSGTCLEPDKNRRWAPTQTFAWTVTALDCFPGWCSGVATWSCMKSEHCQSEHDLHQSHDDIMCNLDTKAGPFQPLAGAFISAMSPCTSMVSQCTMPKTLDFSHAIGCFDDSKTSTGRLTTEMFVDTGCCHRTSHVEKNAKIDLMIISFWAGQSWEMQELRQNFQLMPSLQDRSKLDFMEVGPRGFSIPLKCVAECEWLWLPMKEWTTHLFHRPVVILSMAGQHLERCSWNLGQKNLPRDSSSADFITRARLSSVRRQAWQLYSMSKRGRPL